MSSWTLPLNLQWPFEITTWPWQVIDLSSYNDLLRSQLVLYWAYIFSLYTCIFTLQRYSQIFPSVVLWVFRKMGPLMTSGDLAKKVTMPNVHIIYKNFIRFLSEHANGLHTFWISKRLAQDSHHTRPYTRCLPLSVIAK